MQAESIVFKTKVQGFSFEVSVAKDASCDAIFSELDRRGITGIKTVLSAGRRLLPDSPVSELRVSSPLLILRNADAPPLPSDAAEAKPEARAAAGSSLDWTFQDSASREKQERDRQMQLEAEKIGLAREAAQKYSEYEGGGDIEIRDQNGQRVQLPASDRKNLIAAQLLHERGKSLAEAGRNEDALAILLDAEKCFDSVSPALLKIIDNFGLLELDIAWLLLKLGRLEHFDRAREKLSMAKTALQLAHGKNMERLEQIKGDDATAAKTLYVRLALLEGIEAFLRGQSVTAQSYLSYAEDLLRELRVEDSEVAPLVAMGFTAAEARRGLRIAGKDAERATQVILARREQLAEQRRERRRRRRQERLGRTADGSLVDMELLTSMVQMGFEEKLAALALRQCNNDLASATEVITTTPSVLLEMEPAPSVLSAEALEHVMAMGFPRRAAEGALQRAHGNVDQAISFLLDSSQPMDVDEEEEPGLLEENDDQEEEAEMDRQEKDGVVAESPEEETKRLKLEAAENDLLDNLARRQGNRRDADDDFDCNLDEENELINQYKKLLAERM